LEQAGFRVSPGDRLRAYRVLAGPGKAYLREPERLKYLLAPILCRSGAEQDQFYPIFDAYLKEVRAADWTLEKAPAPRTSWWLWLLGVGVAAALLYVGWLLIRPNPVPVVPVADFAGPTYASEGDTVLFENKSFLPGDSTAYGMRWEMRDAVTGKTVFTDTTTYDWAFVVPTLDDTSYRKEVLLSVTAPDTETEYTARQPFDILCPVPPGVVGIDGLPPGRSLTQGARLGPLSPILDNTLGEELAEYPWTYEWQLGDGRTEFGSEISPIYDAAGVFRLRLSVRDTSAGAYCSTTVGLELEVRKPNRDTLITLPPLAYQRLQEQPVASWRSWVWQVPYFLALIVVGLWWRWWDRRRRTATDDAPAAETTVAQIQVSDRAPYYIPWQDQSHYLPIGAAQFRLADAMRLRQAGTRRNIDVGGTVDATIQRGGFPEVRYAHSTRPSEYLLLIDEETERSHLGRLFRHLATQLRGQDVFAEVFYYRKQFNRFWNAEHPEGMSLGKLAFYHNKHRLLILGDAHELLDPGATDVPRLRPEPLAELRAWRQRILLTPQPPVSWTFREKLLAKHFALFPADLRGLSDAAQWLEANAEDPSERFDSWRERQSRLRREEDVEYRRWRRWRDHRDYLAPYPALETWFLALAVYPQLNWELTIAIGRALQDYGVEVNYDNLLYLARIPSLREGRFPPRLRREMLAALDPEVEQIARRVVREELAAVRLLAGSGHAGLELESELALQNFALDPTDPTARETIRQLMAAGVLTPQQRGDLTRFVEREQAAANVGTGESLLTKTLKTSAAPPPVDLEEYFADPAEQEPAARPPFFSVRFWIALVASLFVLLLFAGLLRTDRTPGLQRRLFGTPTAVATPAPGLERRAPRRNLLAEEVYLGSGAQDAHDAALRALQQEDYATAESRFRAAIRLQNFQPSEAELNLLRLYYNRGRDYFNAYQAGLEQGDPLAAASRYFQQGVELPGALRDSLQRRGLARLFSDSLRWAAIQEYSRHGLGLSYYFAGDTALAKALYLTLPRRFFDTLSFSPNLQTFIAGEEETSRLLGIAPQELDGNVTELVVNYYLRTNSAAAETVIEAIVTNDTSVRAVQLPTTLVNGSTEIASGLGSTTLYLEPRREYPEQADSILVLLRQGDADVLDRRWLAYPKDWTAPESQVLKSYPLTVRDAFTRVVIDNVNLTITEPLAGGKPRVYSSYVQAETKLPDLTGDNIQVTFRHQGYNTKQMPYSTFRSMLEDNGEFELTPNEGFVRDQVLESLQKENYENVLDLMVGWSRVYDYSQYDDWREWRNEWFRARQLQDKSDPVREAAAAIALRTIESRVRDLARSFLATLPSSTRILADERTSDPPLTSSPQDRVARTTPTTEPPGSSVGDAIDPKTQEVLKRVGRSRLVGNNDPVPITDFGGASGGKYQVELELFTNVYNSTAKMRAIVDLDANVIQVQSYSHFQSKSADDPVLGDGTASVTTASQDYSQFRVYLSYGTLYLEQVMNPAGAVGRLRLEGATWQENQRLDLQPIRRGAIRSKKGG
jgi:hypothetical protein